MSSAVTAFALPRSSQTPGWLPAIVLVAATALIGPSLGAPARPLFVLGSALAGWFAWSKSPGAHLQAALVLFSFAPILRRLVDEHAGFDPNSMMIAGPLIALLAPVPELRSLTLPGQVQDRAGAPFLIFGACVAYAFLLTVAHGDWSQAISGGLKWGAPVLYGVALFRQTENPAALLRDLAAAFTLILPVTSAYGIYQYVSPQMWDCYWMKQAAITSAGLPLPYQVRVFSTMHAPAAFATFTAVGILLVYLLRSAWYERLVIVPAALALGLSLYRTAWVALGVSILFCLLLRATRVRASNVLVLLAAAIVVLLSISPFNEVIADRLSSLANAAHDHSGQERLAEFTTLWNSPGSALIGNGFTFIDTARAGAEPLDGMISFCWSCMGIAVGLVCLASLIYLIVRAIAAALHTKEREGAVLGALACGWLIQLPLAGIAAGEIGFLFWTVMAMAIRMPQSGAAS